MQGLAITFVSDETDAKTLNAVQERFEVDISELPEEIDLSSYIEGRWETTRHARSSHLDLKNKIKTVEL